MSKEMYVNLPVSDLQAARDFYTKIGFTVKEDFTSEQALCVLFGQFTFMLVSEDFYRTVAERQVADTSAVSEVAIAFTLDSREAVDAMLATAKKAGATHIHEGAEEEEVMYSARFRDPFGHQFAIHAWIS